MPSSVLGDQVPHSLLFPNQPLFCLPPHVFGCTCFVHLLTPGQDKLSAKAAKCIFLGYSRLQHRYRCYSLDTHRYFVSTDVTFFLTFLYFLYPTAFQSRGLISTSHLSHSNLIIQVPSYSTSSVSGLYSLSAYQHRAS